MKISLKNKSSAIIASTLVAAFFLLHYFVYLDNSGNDFPLLQSYTDPPFSVKQLNLCEEKYPSYFHPFRKVQYTYQIHSAGTDFIINSEDDIYGECNLTEKADSWIFTPKMIADNWTPEDYWAGYDEEGFMRSFAGGEYSNILFFLVQYSLIATFIYIFLRPEKSK